MENLSNITITKATRVKDGEGKHGPWILYRLWIDDPDWKDIEFSYFQSGKKAHPTEGMKVSSFEFKEDDRDGYQATKIGEEKAKPKPKPNPKNTGGQQGGGYNDSKTLNTCFMCAKDIVVALIQVGQGGSKSIMLAEEAKTVVIDLALAFHKASENGAANPGGEPDQNEAKPETGQPESEPQTEKSTFDSYNYQLVNTAWKDREELAEWWAERQKSLHKLTKDERKKLIKAYSEELGETK